MGSAIDWYISLNLSTEMLYLALSVNYVSFLPLTDGAPFLGINEYGTEALLLVYCLA
jgi:hypothetical protein